MPAYAALLRGVMPTNCKMADLKRAFEAAGFTDVRTLLSSGNVVFNARATPTSALERRAEKAMHTGLGRTFGTIVRSTEYLQQLLASDPFAEFKLGPQSKCVVTFLRQCESVPALPIERDGARILKVVANEAYSAYVPGPKGPVFMTLLERTFGSDVTTRTLDTVRKCAAA